MAYTSVCVVTNSQEWKKIIYTIFISINKKITKKIIFVL